jgi:hypothetical protein
VHDIRVAVRRTILKRLNFEMNSKSAQILGMLVAMGGALGGCEGAQWSNMATLGVTCCLFFGTLGLGRRATSVAPTTQNAPHNK